MLTAPCRLSNVKYCISEQHKEATDARISRDEKDTQEVLPNLCQRIPFTVTAQTSLRNIATGVTAPSVYVHKSKIIGKRILQLPHTHSGRTTTLSPLIMETKSVIKIQEEHVHVDHQLLFQRLVTIGMKNGELQTVFDYELCHYRPQTFRNSALTQNYPNIGSTFSVCWV